MKGIRIDMDILKKLTIQNLKLNKKRTIVTIIGIMLSSALICGLVGLVSSFQQTFINMVKDNVGNYHTRFYDVPKEELKYIQNNIKVESNFITHELGIAKLEDSKNEYKPYISILEYDELALNDNGVKLLEGRLPQNSGELLISNHIKTNARIEYNIGDNITFNVGKRVDKDGNLLNQDDSYILYNENGEMINEEYIIDTVSRSYIIVGIIDRPDYSIENYSSPAYTAITHIDEIADVVDISVLYKNPKEYIENNNAILEIDEENKEGLYDIRVNKELLRYQGSVSNSALKVLYGIASVVMVIIIFSSVFVIRNSFSISVAEKNKQYGMLSSVGATKKQIKRTVLFEGFIIGLIAIPLGILCGVIGIVILLQVVNYLLEDALNGVTFVYSLPIIPIIISIVISFLTIYLSCIIPARRASKISPIEAIRGNDDIKIKSKKIKTPKYIKKLFWIGGVIASKNLKRSRKKYATTVISIVISIVIFISLSTFIDYGNKVSGLYYTELNFNMIMSSNLEEEKIDLYKSIIKLDDIEKYSYYYDATISMDEKYYSDFGKQIFERYGGEPYISIAVYNDEYFKEYAMSLGIDEKNYDKGAILIDDFIEYLPDNKKVVKSIYTVKPNDIINLSLDDEKNIDIKILGKTDKRPMGLESTYVEGGILIVSENYLDGSEYNLSDLFIKSNNATKLENTINDLAKVDDNYKGAMINNFDKLVEMENRMVLVISIFLYGFITVISLIGVTNIFNTITTNMILRSKEFAMLKSVGMTKKEFNKMIRLESILYGLKSLLIGIPIGILGSYQIYLSYAESVDMGYSLPIQSIIISIIFVFIIVGVTMKYSLNKINKQNIIETIRNDNI